MDKPYWEMTDEELMKHYDEQSEKLVDVYLTQIARNKIIMNKKLRAKIKAFINQEVIKEINNGLV